MFQNFAVLGVFPKIIIGIVLLVIFIFEVVMFINAIVNKKISNDRRALWIIGMVFIHPFVAIGYYFTDYKKS